MIESMAWLAFVGLGLAYAQTCCGTASLLSPTAADAPAALLGVATEPSMAPAPAVSRDLFNFLGLNIPGAVVQPALPLPPAAQGNTIDPAKGYVVEKLADGVYAAFDSSFYSTMFAITATGVVYFDAPPSFGAALLATVAEVTPLNVTHLVYSHAHIDHIGGAAVFASALPDLQIVSSETVATELARRADPNRPVPTIVFRDDAAYDFGGVAVQLTDVPDAHAGSGNVVVAFLPASKTLMAVDIVSPGWSPFRTFGLTGNLDAYVELHYMLLEYNFAAFVAGHTRRAGSRVDVEVALEYALDVRDAQAIGVTDDQDALFAAALAAAGAAADNAWLLADLVQRGQVQRCYEAVIGKWGGRLGGVDVYLRSHCMAWKDYFNTEGSAAAVLPTIAGPVMGYATGPEGGF